ncbi:MAG: hypothetical protein AAFQ88_14325, partial [Pseudomonadota bacterium]
MLDAEATRPSSAKRMRARRLVSGLPASPRGGMGYPKGGGAWVEDAERSRYVDCDLRDGALIAGHAHPMVLAALEDFLAMRATAARDAQALAALTTYLLSRVSGAARVLYTPCPTSAIIQAEAMARAATGRRPILHLGPQADPGQRFRVTGAVFRHPPTEDTALAEILDDLAPAAVILATGGETAGTAETNGLAGACAERGILLLRDDRSSPLSATFDGETVVDGRILGSILGGGLPIGAVTGTAAFFETARRGMATAPPTAEIAPSGGPDGAAPIAAVAGLATLQLLEQPGAQARLHEAGRAIFQSVDRAIKAMAPAARLSGTEERFRISFEDGAGLCLRRFSDVLLAQGVVQRGGVFNVSLAHDTEAISQT